MTTKSKKSLDEVRGALAAAKLRNQVVEMWVWDGDCPSGNDCGFTGWFKRPRPTKKMTCPCGCNYVLELEYDCCNGDVALANTRITRADFNIKKGELKKLIIAAVEP